MANGIARRTKKNVRFDPTDPAEMAAAQRLAEIAAILSAVVIRKRHKRAADVPKRLDRHGPSAQKVIRSLDEQVRFDPSISRSQVRVVIEVWSQSPREIPLVLNDDLIQATTVD